MTLPHDCSSFRYTVFHHLKKKSFNGSQKAAVRKYILRDPPKDFSHAKEVLNQLLSPLESPLESVASLDMLLESPLESPLNPVLPLEG